MFANYVINIRRRKMLLFSVLNNYHNVQKKQGFKTKQKLKFEKITSVFRKDFFGFLGISQYYLKLKCRISIKKIVEWKKITSL